MYIQVGLRIYASTLDYYSHVNWSQSGKTGPSHMDEVLRTADDLRSKESITGATCTTNYSCNSLQIEQCHYLASRMTDNLMPFGFFFMCVFPRNKEYMYMYMYVNVPHHRLDWPTTAATINQATNTANTD